MRPGERGELVFFLCGAALSFATARAGFCVWAALALCRQRAHAADDVLSPMPGWSVHGSCSLSVNYHAIAEWTRAQGGQCMHRQSRESGLSLNAFAFGLPELGETRLAFDTTWRLAVPAICSCSKFLENHYDSMSLEQTRFAAASRRLRRPDLLPAVSPISVGRSRQVACRRACVLI